MYKLFTLQTNNTNAIMSLKTKILSTVTQLHRLCWHWKQVLASKFKSQNSNHHSTNQAWPIFFEDLCICEFCFVSFEKFGGSDIKVHGFKNIPQNLWPNEIQQIDIDLSAYFCHFVFYLFHEEMKEDPQVEDPQVEVFMILSLFLKMFSCQVEKLSFSETNNVFLIVPQN